MSILLEVIVTSVHEAIQAERGGADRLELVTALDHGGLTPSLDVVRRVVETVSIPVRVMLREKASMSITTAGIARLRAEAVRLSKLRINGLVAGFAHTGELDIEATREVLAGVPNIPLTFHRAFDYTTEPLAAFEKLKQLPQIDRVLTDGGRGSWNARAARIVEWQRAVPQIKMLFATGRDIRKLSELARYPGISEVHVGRAARVPSTTSGIVDCDRVAAVKRVLEGGF